MPEGVPAGTETMPVAGSSSGTGAPTETGVAGVITVPLTFEGVAEAPFSESLVYALTTFVEPVAPFTGNGMSLLARIGAAITSTVIEAILQFAGLSFSQI